MGNTCSSVHIALTGTTPEAINGIVRAYSGPLKVLTDKSRATQWSKVFGKPLSANDAFKIELREGQRLEDLELALLPVLPVESVRLHSAS